MWYSRSRKDPISDSDPFVDDPKTTGISSFIALCFIELHRCCVFYKWEARPSTSKKKKNYNLLYYETCFIAVSVGSGTEPGVSQRYVYLLLNTSAALSLFNNAKEVWISGQC